MDVVRAALSKANNAWNQDRRYKERKSVNPAVNRKTKRRISAQLVEKRFSFRLKKPPVGKSALGWFQ